MRLAITQAQTALQEGEGMAFGAVIVKDGQVLSEAHNTVVADTDPTSHAEVNAIRMACIKLGTYELTGSTLYTTCEPCPMCFTAAWWANISKIVFGVSLEDVTNVSREIIVPNSFLNEKGGSAIQIESGFLKGECLELYK
jgi:tRNA(Arg) A34 adenosine deaminase TadA